MKPQIFLIFELGPNGHTWTINTNIRLDVWPNWIVGQAKANVEIPNLMSLDWLLFRNLYIFSKVQKHLFCKVGMSNIALTSIPILELTTIIYSQLDIWQQFNCCFISNFPWLTTTNFDFDHLGYFSLGIKERLHILASFIVLTKWEVANKWSFYRHIM